MSEMISTSYKTYQIVFQETFEKWEAVQWGYENGSLQKVKEYIDRQLKQKPLNIPVFLSSFNGITPATLLSFSSDSDKEVWIKFSLGREDQRRKIKLSELRAYSEKNQRLYQDILKRQQEINRLNKENTKSLALFEPFVYEQTATSQEESS